MSLFQPSRGNAGSTADSYQSPPWSDAPPWSAGGTAVAQPGRTSAIGYEAVFPLNNPGIVAIPVAFFLGWLGTVTDRRPADSARFARMQVRALTGVGAERAGRA